jgi:hypothetical protein
MSKRYLIVSAGLLIVSLLVIACGANLAANTPEEARAGEALPAMQAWSMRCALRARRSSRVNLSSSRFSNQLGRLST